MPSAVRFAEIEIINPDTPQASASPSPSGSPLPVSVHDFPYTECVTSRFAAQTPSLMPPTVRFGEIEIINPDTPQASRSPSPSGTPLQVSPHDFPYTATPSLFKRTLISTPYSSDMEFSPESSYDDHYLITPPPHTEHPLTNSNVSSPYKAQAQLSLKTPSHHYLDPHHFDHSGMHRCLVDGFSSIHYTLSSSPEGRENRIHQCRTFSQYLNTTATYIGLTNLIILHDELPGMEFKLSNSQGEEITVLELLKGIHNVFQKRDPDDPHRKWIDYLTPEGQTIYGLKADRRPGVWAIVHPTH
ncbi:hypothetical protein C0991_001147, partial [Blastosporella zonata]